MGVEIFVPRYEKEERYKRFWAFDAISELAPKDGRLRDRFDYSTATLANTIKSRSEKGDGVCRNLDITLLGAGATAVDVHYFDKTRSGEIYLSSFRPDGELASRVGIRFAQNHKTLSTRYTNETGDGRLDWTWPSFSTDVLSLLREDLIIGRESWAEKLRTEAENYYQKIGAGNPYAVGQIKALMRRMEERSDHYEDNELFVFGQPPSVVEGRLKIDLVASFPEAERYLEILNKNYEFTDVGISIQQERDVRYGYVSDLAFGDFDISLHQLHILTGNQSKAALNLVEGDFSKYMRDTVVFAKGRIMKDKRVEGVLLAADPVVSYPIFRD